MSTVYEELAKQLMSGEVEGSSTYKLRSESLQDKVKFRRIPRLKRELKKYSKLLIPMEIALPFNPQTGKADEKFNEDNKYRPLMSATAMALAIKYMAKQNEALRETLMSRAGINEWDLENNLDVLTETDKKIFRLYRVPRIFTIPVVSINDQRITGREWPVEYTVSINRDDFGNVEGEYPIVLQANKFYSEIIFEEAEHIKQCVEKAKKGLPYELKSTAKGLRGMNLASITDNDLKEVLRDDVYSKIAISEDYPANYLIVYELPLDGSMVLSNRDSYSTLATDELDKMMHITKLTKELGDALKLFKGAYAASDVHYDFWELDMICPSEYDGSSPERDIPKQTRYNPPVSRLIEQGQIYDVIVNKVREHQGKLDDLEARFLASLRIKKLDESVESKIVESIAIGDELSNPFLTQKVILSNKEFINLAFGEEGAMLVASTTAGIADDIPEGSLDSAKASAETKVNLAEILESSEEGIEEEEDSEASSTDESVEGDVINLED